MESLNESMETLLDELPDDPDAQAVEDFVEEQARAVQEEIDKMSEGQRQRRREAYQEVLQQLQGAREVLSRDQRYLRLLCRTGLRALEIHEA